MAQVTQNDCDFCRLNSVAQVTPRLGDLSQVGFYFKKIYFSNEIWFFLDIYREYYISPIYIIFFIDF